MTQKQILENVQNLTAEQLFDYVLEGVITLSMLKGTGDLDESKRKKIESFQKLDDEKHNAYWENCRYGNELALTDYIATWGKREKNHVEEAKDKIKTLEEQRDQKKKEKARILKSLNENQNSYSPGMISKYLSDEVLTAQDLRDCDIPDSIIESINNIKQKELELGDTPDSIPKGYTEVYFWGSPGSGKTCALAAILSTAERKGYLDIATGPGYDYMTHMTNIFIEKNAILPPPSPIETTQYLPFVLKKGNDKPRSVSLIELSGEIFECFFLKNAGKKLPSERHQETFETLMKFLKGENRKIHFFFIDYDKENKKDAKGYTQGNYLSAASVFFKNQDIFGKSTDAVYIVITKSDLMPCKEDQRVAYSKQHLVNNNFSSFINALKDRCKQHSINSGKLTVEPFSLGKVYFQQICNFDETSALKLIDILIERIAPTSKSMLNRFLNK